MQARGEVLITADLDIGKDMRFQRSLSRGSSTEVLNRGLDTSVIEDKKIWREMEGGGGLGGGLSMVATYSQVENTSGCT